MVLWMLEAISIILFLICLYFARNSKRDICILVLAFVYALIFENMNMLIAAGKTGGYFYSTAFHLFLLHTPLMIAFFWAVFIYAGIKIANKFKITPLPLATAIFVVTIDFILDPISSTKYNLWTWIGYSATDGFFGIPGNNFLGWFFVVFVFVSVFIKIENLKIKHKYYFYPVIPFIAYLFFAIVFTFIGFIQNSLGLGKTGEVIFFFAVYFISMGIVLWRKRKS